MPTIDTKQINVTQPEEWEDQCTRYEWTCPQCNTMVHGDSRTDSIFEIKRDPVCIYCRVKNGEFVQMGRKFLRVITKGKTVCQTKSK